MNKNFFAAAILCSSVAVLGISSSAQARPTQGVVGPSLLFGGGSTVFGIDSKFGVADNISIRPAVYFGNGGTLFGAGVTYDFSLPGDSSKFTPFVGGTLLLATGGGASATAVGLVGGADFDVTDTIQLKAAVNIPLTSNNSSTAVQIGAGFKF
jgi:hypothetical protein